jgi:protein-tyrosine phosphatase
MLKLVTTSSGFLYISPMPFKRELDNSKEFDIIWNLTDDYDLADHEKDYAKKVLIGNVPDYGVPKDVPRFLSQVNEVVNCLRSGGRVLIHCLAGHGRTGMALASVLIKLENLNPTQAMRQTLKLCHGPETPEQIYFIKDLFSKK